MGGGQGQGMPTMNGAAPMQQPFNYQQAQQNAMSMAPQAMQQFQQMRSPYGMQHPMMPPNMGYAGKGPSMVQPGMGINDLRTTNGGLLG